MRIKIGTRGSKLALWQTNFVSDRLKEFYKDIIIEIEVIHTKGDKILDVSLSKIGDKGLFTKEIESKLLDGEIDLAVHSLKDLPTKLPDGLTIGAVLKRHEPNDVLISKNKIPFKNLPDGANIATGSLRRQSQLLHLRPDFKIHNIRGNVETRVRKFKENNYDGLILAKAGLERLGLGNEITETIPFDLMLPAVGQGAMAIEIREDSTEVKEILKKLHHEETFIAVKSERTFLRELEGGCQVPIGAYAEIKNDILKLDGFIGSINGKILFRDKVLGNKAKVNEAEAKELGKKLAEILLGKGGDKILEEIYNK